jgi:hypothetical protein
VVVHRGRLTAIHTLMCGRWWHSASLDFGLYFSDCCFFGFLAKIFAIHAASFVLEEPNPEKLETRDALKCGGLASLLISWQHYWYHDIFRTNNWDWFTVLTRLVSRSISLPAVPRRFLPMSPASHSRFFARGLFAEFVREVGRPWRCVLRCQNAWQTRSRPLA